MIKEAEPTRDPMTGGETLPNVNGCRVPAYIVRVGRLFGAGEDDVTVRPTVIDLN
jgi:hypothetical protein